MKIIFGSVVTSGSGSLGGQFISKSKSGLSLRQKPLSRKRKIILSSTNSRLLSFARKSFFQLTASEKTRWNAARLFFKHLYINEQSKPLPLYQFYVMCSVYKYMGVSLVKPTPPSAFIFLPIKFVTIDAHFSISQLNFNYGDKVTGSFRVYVYASPPCRSTSGVNRTYFRYLFNRSSGNTTNTNFYNVYNSMFPGRMRAGKKIFVKVLLIEGGSGVQYVPYFVSAVFY